MINLLPIAEKKKLQKEYLLRAGIVVLCAIFALEVLSLVLFTPSYYALALATQDLARTLLEKQAQSPEGAVEARAMLATIQKEMSALQPSAGVVDVPPSVLLQEIIEQKPQGLTLRGFSYVRTASAVSMEFSGSALTQEDLLAFRRDVKVNPRVLDFKYASSFITKKTDIDFTATVTFK